MRILILTQWYPPEPQEFLSELAQTLQTFGHQVTVMTGFPNWPSGKLYPGYRLRLWQKEELEGVPIIRVPLFPDHSHSSVRRIMNFVSFAISMTLLGPWLAPRVDVIHVIHPPLTMGLPAWIISHYQNIPFTFEIQDMWPETLQATGMLTNKRILAWVGQFAAWVYRQAATIRVISPGFRLNLIGKGVPSEKIHVISNWVDTEFYRPVNPSAELAQKLGLAGHFIVMYAGTIGLAQGLEIVLDAAHLLQRSPEILFVLVGDGVDLSHLKKMAQEWQLQNVKFLGRLQGELMPELYALADVLLVHLKDDPLFRITIPHKVLTYLASGKPVLAAIEGDAADVVRNSGAGMTCAPGDPQALADAVRKFYQMMPSDRVTMGENGRNAAYEIYGRTNLVGQIAKMLESAAEAGAK